MKLQQWKWVRGLVKLQRWRMVCDVDVDVGRRMVFGSEERREQMEKQRMKREREENRNNERDEREISGEKGIIKYIYIYIYIFYNTTTVQFYI